MRVVQAVRSDAFAGVEQYVALVAAELHRRGHEVRVIGGDSVQMRRRLPADLSHVEAASTADVTRGLLSSRGADVVHVHMSAAEIAAIATRPRLRAPIVSTRHFARPRGSGPWGGLLRELSNRSIARQLAISEFVRSHIDGSATVVPNGVADQPEGKYPREAFLLVASRLAPEKDVTTAVTAFTVSGLAQRGWRLLIVGRGALELRIREAIAESGCPDGSIEMLGFVDDASALMAGAGAVVATAPAEPFGLAVVEAMARATPILAARGGAHLETVGPSGWMFTPGSSAELAVLMRALADDPEGSARYGRALQARQRELFGIARHVDGLEAVYREVLV